MSCSWILENPNESISVLYYGIDRPSKKLYNLSLVLLEGELIMKWYADHLQLATFSENGITIVKIKKQYIQKVKKLLLSYFRIYIYILYTYIRTNSTYNHLGFSLDEECSNEKWIAYFLNTNTCQSSSLPYTNTAKLSPIKIFAIYQVLIRQ